MTRATNDARQQLVRIRVRKTMTQGCRSAEPNGKMEAVPEVVCGGVEGPQIDEGGSKAGTRA